MRRSYFATWTADETQFLFVLSVCWLGVWFSFSRRVIGISSKPSILSGSVFIQSSDSSASILMTPSTLSTCVVEDDSSFRWFCAEICTRGLFHFLCTDRSETCSKITISISTLLLRLSRGLGLSWPISTARFSEASSRAVWQFRFGRAEFCKKQK